MWISCLIYKHLILYSTMLLLHKNKLGTCCLISTGTRRTIKMTGSNVFLSQVAWFSFKKKVFWEFHIVVLISPFHRYLKEIKGLSPIAPTKKQLQSWELSWNFMPPFYKIVLHYQKTTISHRVKLPITSFFFQVTIKSLKNCNWIAHAHLNRYAKLKQWDVFYR